MDERPDQQGDRREQGSDPRGVFQPGKGIVIGRPGRPVGAQTDSDAAR